MNPRLFAAVSSLALAVMTVSSGDGFDGDTRNIDEDGVVEVGTVRGGGLTGAPARNSVEAPADRFRRHVICQDWIVQIGGSEPTRSFVFDGEIPDCVEPFVITDEYCPDGAEPLAPLWRSDVLDASGPSYGPWQMVSGYECPGDPLEAQIGSAWRQMVIEPQAIEVLPDNGWAIAVMGVKAALDDSPQTSTVTLLGQQVVLRATPTDHQWSVTDVVSGQSWPGVFEVAAHGEEVLTFERKEHRVQLGLTTKWEGHYSLDGGSTWASAPGTATTVSEPYSVHIYNPRARLVNCNTMGDCVGNGESSNPFTLTDPDADGIDNFEVPDAQIGEYLKARAK